MKTSVAVADYEYAFKTNRAELVRIYQSVLKHRRKSVLERGLDRSLWITIPILMGVGIVSALAEDYWVLGILLLLLVFTGAAWAIGYGLVPVMSANAHVKKHQGVQTLRLAADGIGSGCDLCEHHFSWDTIERAVVTDELVLFFYNKSCAIPLPLRAVPEDGQLPLKRYLEARLGNRVDAAGH